MAGWTSSLDAPWIEYTGRDQPFDDNGAPLSDDPQASYTEICFIPRIQLHLPDGSSSELRSSDTPECVPVGYPTPAFTGTFYSTDSSRMRFDSDNGVLYLADGGRYFFGASIFWASGTPFSFAFNGIDIDDVGNASPRFSYVSGRRNDQRNGDQWTVNGRVEKGFSIAGKSAEAYFAVDNLLGQDDVTLYEATANAGALGLRSFNRRFGRRWEMGMSLHI